VARLLSRLQVDPDAVARLTRRQATGLEQALEAAGDHAGLAQLWHVRALIWWIKCQSGEAERAWRRAAEEARQAGDVRLVSDVVGWEAASVAVGPTPVGAAIARCEEIRAILKDDPWAEALALQPLASLHAMRGEFSTAYELLDESSATLVGFGPTVDAAVSHPEVFVAVLAGDLDRAERHLRSGRRILEHMGERAVLASTESYLAQVALLAGREAEADRLARRCAALATEDDAWAQVAWRQVRARVLAGRGQTDRALELARDAVDIAMSTDHLNTQADSLLDLGFVHSAAGSEDDASEARARALEIYQAKGNVVRAREARGLLARPVGV
jgi:tetratricopeptide (TPR) repeat protein